MSSNRYPTRPITELEDRLYKEMGLVIDTFCKDKTASYKLDFVLNAIAFSEPLSRAVIATLAHQGNSLYTEIKNVKSRTQKYPH